MTQLHQWTGGFLAWNHQIGCHILRTLLTVLVWWHSAWIRYVSTSAGTGDQCCLNHLLVNFEDVSETMCHLTG